MTFNEFVARWNGKYVDTDNAYAAQCMDLMHQYCVEMLGIADLSVLAAPSAKAVYDNFPNVKGSELFEQIANTPTGIPIEGDIVFWGNAPYGHVAIFIEGDTNSFRSFDQNYPTGSPCHVQPHTYANVSGWLRFKETINLQAQLDQMRKERDDNHNETLKLYDALRTQHNVEVALAEINKLISIEDTLIGKEKQLEDANKKIVVLDQKINDLLASNATLAAENQKLGDEVKTQAQTITEQGLNITSLGQEITEIKSSAKLPVFSGWKLKIMQFLASL